MRLIDNILYLEFSDAVACGLGSENYIKKEKSRGAKWAIFIKDPRDNRRLLIEYESLADKKKELVLKHFGNPYEYHSKEPIRKMVVKDIQAEAFYIDYRYGDDNDKCLPDVKIQEYTTAASWLNMLVKAQQDFKSIKKELGISVSTFWLQVGELIETDKVQLPSNYKRLLEKIENYKASGYEVLIHKLYGKANAAKIDCEVSEAVLLELISQPNANDIMTARRYNQWAVQNNKQQITDRTVTNWRQKNNHLIHSEKYGVRDSYNVFGKHIMRRRPSAPLLLVEHDDNELDLYFQSVKVKGSRTEVYYFNRFVLAVVIDAFNDYILGWAYAETYTKDLIRMAYLDAMYHVKELTGGWYLPHQIRSDRFGLDVNLTNDLAQFYQSLAHYTPATVKVARSKYIERSFGTSWHQALSVYKNYAGKNITAKTKTNQDFIDANKKEFPSTEQAPAQIAHFISTMRHLVNEKTGQSRQEQWLEAFHASEKSKQHVIGEMQLLMKIGTPHTHLNKITNRGITPAINCVQRTYEIPEAYYLKTIGKTVQVVYDPMDYSRILVTDGKDLRFIAREVELMPSALADFQEGDRKKLNDRLNEKVRHQQTIAAKRNTQKDILQRNRIDIESLAMAGVHTKAINHELQLNYMPAQLDQPVTNRITNERSIDDVLNDF